MDSRPYEAEEVLSLDRIKRAVASRVTEAAEASLKQGVPFDVGNLAELTENELESIKEAIQSSEAAKEKAREYMQSKVSEIVDGFINKHKAELEALGVPEKYM